MEHDDCKFMGDDGWCELMFHEPDEMKSICPICKDYEPKEKDERQLNGQR